VSNYRPISLLSLVSKVFERCVFNQLISHISSQLHHLQFDFLRGKSTTSQLLHDLQDIHQALDSRNQVDAVYLDFENAFDKVNHKLLLTKLHKFGIRGDLLCWFEIISLAATKESLFWVRPRVHFLYCLEFLRDQYWGPPFPGICERSSTFHLGWINCAGNVCRRYQVLPSGERFTRLRRSAEWSE
jgi:hypothetical protein